MRIFYSTLFYLFTPYILLRLLWRGFKLPGCWSRWHERFAYYYGRNHRQGVIWIHAVSVGEAESVFSLVRLIRQRMPARSILVTTTTPTGSARVTAVLGDEVEHVYLPYDLPDAVARFLSHFKPAVALIVETEIWPNFFRQCGIRSIPLYIVNARLSEKSARGYRKIPSLFLPAMANLTAIAAQTREDVERFIAIGADEKKVVKTGNIKFDLEISDQIVEQGKALRNTVFPGRLVWIIASTHRGEDELFLQTYKQVKQQFAALLMVLVPRHPERFVEVQKLCIKERLNVVMRTENTSCRDSTDIFIVDTMGELKMLYAAADIAFVAGSMQPVGGHNVLEPAALGKPVVFGPFMFNFKEIAKGLLDAKAAVQCHDMEAVVREITELLADEQKRKEFGAKGKEFVKNNQGALERVYALVEQSLAK